MTHNVTGGYPSSLPPKRPTRSSKQTKTSSTSTAKDAASKVSQVIKKYDLIKPIVHSYQSKPKSAYLDRMREAVKRTKTRLSA